MKWSVCRNQNGTEVKYYKYADHYGPNSGIEYLATCEPDGSFTVATHDGDFNKVRYAGEYRDYRKVDEAAKYAELPFVCHIAHNAEKAYMLVTKTGYYYIRVE